MYTRADLQNFKKTIEMDEDRRVVATTVAQLRAAILNTARQEKTKYFYKCVAVPTDRRRYNVIMAVVDDLKTIFPDVSIKYDEETCNRTGTKINQGIYVDWS